MTDLVAMRQAIITQGPLTYKAIFATFPSLNVHAARKFTIIDTEGHPDHVWMTVLQEDGTEVTPVNPSPEQEIDLSIFNAMDTFEDIAQVCAKAFKVNEDNEVLPENRPVFDAPSIEVSSV